MAACSTAAEHQAHAARASQCACNTSAPVHHAQLPTHLAAHHAIKQTGAVSKKMAGSPVLQKLAGSFGFFQSNYRRSFNRPDQRRPWFSFLPVGPILITTRVGTRAPLPPCSWPEEVSKQEDGQHLAHCPNDYVFAAMSSPRVYL